VCVCVCVSMSVCVAVYVRGGQSGGGERERTEKGVRASDGRGG
jgi:hypothetical protein